MKKLTNLMLFLTMAISLQAYSQSNLETYLQETNNFSARFHQTIFNKKVSKSSGNLVMNKPDQFLWDYQKPSEQKIVSNGQEVFFYDKDLQQVTVYKQRDVIGNTAAIILNAGKGLRQKFKITRENNFPNEIKELSKNSEIYRLKPTQKQNEFNAIWLVLNNKQLIAVLLESDKQKTLLTFDEIKRNKSLDNDVFNFVIPENVDVIHNY